MIDYKSLYLSPRGRIGRQTFMVATVGLAITTLMLGLVPFFGPILILPLLWPFTCITAKRFHDAGRSAWPTVVVAFICAATGMVATLIGVMATDATYAPSAFAVAGPVVIACGLSSVCAIGVSVLAAAAGSEATVNRFGTPESSALSLRQLFGDDQP